jgi:hypothetical protein
VIALSPGLSWLVIAGATALVVGLTGLFIATYRIACWLIATTMRALEENSS